MRVRGRLRGVVRLGGVGGGKKGENGIHIFTEGLQVLDIW